MRALLAVGVSISVHGAVLLGVTMAPERPRSTPGVDATPVEVFEAPAAERTSAPPAPPSRATAPARARRKAAVNVNVNVNVTGVGVAEDVDVDVDVDEPAPTTSTPTPTPTPTPTASSAASPSPSPFDVRALHAQLAAAAQRCYPAAAKRFRLTGEAAVDFCLDGAGALKSTSLARSSGQELLDGAARDCVIPGALPFPAEASGGCYSVPVRFR